MAGGTSLSQRPPDLEARLKAVHDAFPDQGFDPSWRNQCTHGGCGECRDIEKYVHANPHWREWTAVDCFAMNAVSLMRESFAYFLPAFICATYVDPEEADVAVESSAWQFLDRPSRWMPRRPNGTESAGARLLRQYTPEQQAVILDWLRYYAENLSIDDEQKEGYLRQVGALAEERSS